MENNRVFVVANSHIDPVWLWDKYEGIDEVINTFRSACDRLDEYPYIKFSASSTCFYKCVEEYAPEVFERIKAHVASGRWEITGGWWVEADCNLPLSESFYKSAELSKRYLSARFGVDTPVAFSPDSFGHAASLPEILANSGFKYYIFCRPGENEKPDLPSNLFYWEHGGKRVLCYRLKYHYTHGFEFDPEKVEKDLGNESFLKDGLACYFFGMGDHGGGPTKAEIESLTEIRDRRQDMDIIFSTCLEFFQEAEKCSDIPVYSGDLHYHAVGCYSVNRNIKQAVRSAERSLCYAQRLLDLSAKEEDLDPLWESTIFNQFHDILPGSCSSAAAVQALDEPGSVRNSCSRISYGALKSISNGIPVKCPQGEFRIFNSTDQDVTGPFEIESFLLYFRPGAPFKDSTSKVVPIQQIAPSVRCGNHRWLFIDTIPARSMKSYYFDTEHGPATWQTGSCFYVSGSDISNSRFKVEAPGMIEDKHAGKTFFKSPVSLGIVRDDSDTRSHGIPGYGPAEGYFNPVSCFVDTGPLASYLISRQEYGHSSAELKFTVYAGLPYVDLEISVRWLEERSLLKLEVEPTCEFGSVLVDGPGAVIEKRTDGAEEPLHGWLLAGELGILQDGAFAFDRVGDKIRVTLVRSSLYGYDQSSVLDHAGLMQHTDIGEHKFKLRLVSQQGLAVSDMSTLLTAFIEPFSVQRDNA